MTGKKTKKPKDEGHFTHDSAFKDLVQDFPLDTVRWLTPEAEATYGPIEEIIFLREEMKHQWLNDEGRELDIPMLIRFKSGPAIISLIEHKGDKPTFSIYKVAHYMLDLAETYPKIPIVPILVFADSAKWRKDVKREIKIEVFGNTWLYFKYHKVKLKDMKASEALGSDNPVLHILSPLMDYPKEDRFKVAADAYLNLKRQTDEVRFRKYMDFIDKYAKIKKGEKVELLDLLKHREEGIMLREALLEEGREEGLEKGREEGREEGREKGREECREEVICNLLQFGMEPDFVAKATGFSLEMVVRIQKSKQKP